MPTVNWENLRELFAADGHPRAIEVDGLDLGLWQRYVNFLRKTEAIIRAERDGKPVPLPPVLDAHWFRPRGSLLYIDLPGLTLRCLLVEPTRMRLDFAPEAIDGPPRARLVLRIMSTLGRRLGRTVRLIDAKTGTPLLRYRHSEGFTPLFLLA